MTVTLELPPDVEVEIATEAAEKGIPLPDYLIAVIRDRRNIQQGVENYLLSESALAKDWLKPEEDEAWQHLSKAI